MVIIIVVSRGSTCWMSLPYISINNIVKQAIEKIDEFAKRYRRNSCFTFSVKCGNMQVLFSSPVVIDSDVVDGSNSDEEKKERDYEEDGEDGEDEEVEE
jgi:hypothetical protein